MKVADFEKEFRALPENEQMEVMRKIMPGFCGSMMSDPKGVQEMFSLLTEGCGERMANMVSVMGMMMKGRKGGGCCG